MGTILRLPLIEGGEFTHKYGLEQKIRFTLHLNSNKMNLDKYFTNIQVTYKPFGTGLQLFRKWQSTSENLYDWQLVRQKCWKRVEKILHEP